MDAIEARKLTKANLKYDSRLFEILKEITSAAEKGEFTLIVDFKLTPEEMKSLENLGYSIQDRPDLGAYGANNVLYHKQTISW